MLISIPVYLILGLELICKTHILGLCSSAVWVKPLSLLCSQPEVYAWYDHIIIIPSHNLLQSQTAWNWVFIAVLSRSFWIMWTDSTDAVLLWNFGQVHISILHYNSIYMAEKGVGGGGHDQCDILPSLMLDWIWADVNIRQVMLMCIHR